MSWKCTRTPAGSRGITSVSRKSTSPPGLHWWLESMNRMSPGPSAEKGRQSSVSTWVCSHSTAKPVILARGRGSIAVIFVSSPPSATARARKRVECPEPTSTMRRGRSVRTIAYAAAASRRGNQSWSQRGAGGGSAPIASRSTAYFSMKLNNQAVLRHERARHLLLQLARHAIEHVVVVLGIVVEHRQPLRAGGAAQAHALLPGRVSPADVRAVLRIGVHAVVDHQVRVLDERKDVAVGRARHVLGVGEIAHRAAVEVDAVAGRPVGMVEGRGAQLNAGSGRERLARLEFSVLHARAEHLRRDREERRHHELAEHAAQRHALGEVSGPQAEAVVRLEERAEEGQPADMVEVRVGEEQIRIHRSILGQRVAQVAQPGPGIEHQQALAAAHLERGGVAAIARGARPGAGDRAAHAPEAHGESHALNIACKMRLWGRDRLERSLFGFIIRYSKRDQLMIVPLVLATMVVYYLSLDLPKTIINAAIQGGRFPQPDATAGFLGLQLGRIEYLFALSLVFLGLIVLNGWLKFRINTMKGWMGERMLRRLRYALYDYILRFPLARFRRVKAAEAATMIKDEVEPLGGFVGEALITPLFLGGQALTAMFFILYQHWALGLIALAVVGVQAVVIPKLRQRLLVLGRERQLTARALAGRIAETVDGAAEIHANGTSNYERAEISARLGRIFRIRFEFYQRKFLIKFLNNFLSQVTPFLFYTVGGYLVIVGRLDIGALVAVIAAYKDLPSPVKELIDWDQQRLDTEIKYQQVVEQFDDGEIAPPEMQAMIESPQLPKDGRLRTSNLSLLDESGARVVDNVSFEAASGEHIALVGKPGSGASELAQLLARLMPSSSGSIELGGIDLTRAPEAVTGRAIGYVGASAYLFPARVRDNVLYGLKHRPIRERTYEKELAAEREFQLREAVRTGSCALDIEADWIDYQAAGCSGPEDIEARIVDLLRAVDLEETIFELGLRSRAQKHAGEEVDERVLEARRQLRERLESLGIKDWVERFDPSQYNRNATLAENLLFGTPVGRGFDVDNLAGNAYVRQVLRATGLDELLVRTGHKVAETMVELFSGLPPGHEFFAQYSFINQDDLPQFEAILKRAADHGLKELPEADRRALLALPFKLIATRHRLGLIDESFEARVIEARRHFAAHLPEELKGAVEFFDPERYNSAATLQDNILFGKIVTGQAGAVERITKLVRDLLDELGLRMMVVRNGLDFQVGVGGARLGPADRQKVALVRALLKRPVLLVLDQAAAGLDPASQKRVVEGVPGG